MKSPPSASTDPRASRFPSEAVLELQRLSARISSDLEAADATRVVLEHAVDALDAVRASAILLDDAGEVTTIVGTASPRTGSVEDIPDSLVAPVHAIATLPEPRFLATDEEVVEAWPEVADLRPPGAGGVAGLPLLAGEHRLGVLTIVFEDPGPFTPTDRVRLLALADLLAGVVERAHLAARERLTRSHLDFLADASRALAESLDLDATLRTAAALAIPILADGAILDVRDADGGFRRAVSLPAGSSAEAEVLAANSPPTDADHPTVEAMRGRWTVRYEVSDELISRATRNAAHAEAARRARGRYAMTAPLMLGSDPFGAITLYRSNAGPYTDEEVRIAEEFARRAARAVENSRLHSEHQRALAHANALVRLNAAAAGADSPDEVAGLLLDVVVPLAGASRGAVLEYDAAAGDLVVTRVVGYATHPSERIGLAGTPAEAALTSGEIIVGRRDDWGDRYRRPTGWPKRMSDAFLVAPLIVGGERVGVISLGFAHDPSLRGSLLETLHGLIDAGAQAIARATLVDEQRRQLERESTVARLNEAVAEARSPDAVARTLLAAVFEPFESRSASVALLDEAAKEFVLAGVLSGENRRPNVRSRWPVELPSPARDVVRSGAPLVLSPAEYRERYPDFADVADSADVGSYVALPLTAAGRAVGALALTFNDKRAVGATELEDLRAIAEGGGAAIEQSRLREAERRALGILETVVAELPVGVVVVDAVSGRVLHANAAVGNLLGRQPRLGIHIDDARTIIRYPDGRALPVEDSPLAVCARDGVPAGPIEVVVLRDDASERRVILDATPVRDDAGRLLAAAGTWTDITERRTAEAAREAFLGILSHELRTPITSILAGSQILARRTLATEDAGLVADINAESERLHRLVEDLLVLSRVERGADLRRADPVLVQHVARRVMAHEASRWPDRQFRASIPPGLPAASGDEAYIEQIIRNLLSNAAKYGPPGGLIELVLAHEPDGVAIRVLDRGPGFGPDDLPRVFELFYRSPTATKAAPGAGIGLYTSRVLTEAMGGRIWVANRPDGGAEVGALLPISSLDAEV
jgi:signal transduction histidine kinase/GAF domain-containing protein